ncbi:hypothetical protein BHMPCIPO_02522 [Ensifer sesbaniae]|nr:hypothetical protein [Ensifer sesbaniae]
MHCTMQHDVRGKRECLTSTPNFDCDSLRPLRIASRSPAPRCAAPSFGSWSSEVATGRDLRLAGYCERCVDRLLYLHGTTLGTVVAAPVVAFGLTALTLVVSSIHLDIFSPPPSDNDVTIQVVHSTQGTSDCGTIVVLAFGELDGQRGDRLHCSTMLTQSAGRSSRLTGSIAESVPFTRPDRILPPTDRRG